MKSRQPSRQRLPGAEGVGTGLHLNLGRVVGEEIVGEVAWVFRTCRTSQGKREDIAAFVWCMENRFDADLHRRHVPGLYQTRNPISTRPSNWDSDDIRSTWVYNIGKR